MPTFRNTITGRVVDVADDSPVLAQMDRSKRWERVTDAPTASVDGIGASPVTVNVSGSVLPERDVVEAVRDAIAEPEAKDVRAWARAEGVDVPARGPLPDDVIDRYKAAQE